LRLVVKSAAACRGRDRGRQPTWPKRLHQADTDAAAEDRHRSHNATRTSDRRAIDRRLFIGVGSTSRSALSRAEHPDLVIPFWAISGSTGAAMMGSSGVPA